MSAETNMPASLAFIGFGEVGQIFARGSQPRFAIVCHCDPKSFVRQATMKKVSDLGFVFDEEYLHFRVN